MKTITTNTLTFVSANASGVRVTAWKTDRRHPITGDIIPEDHTITWPTLRAAAGQDDGALRAVYAPIYEQARAACPTEDVTGWRVEFDGDISGATAQSLARLDVRVEYTAREGAERVAEAMRGRLRQHAQTDSWSVDVVPIRSDDAPVKTGPSANDRAMGDAQRAIYRQGRP